MADPSAAVPTSSDVVVDDGSASGSAATQGPNPAAEIVSWIAAAMGFFLIILATRRVPRTKGRWLEGDDYATQKRILTYHGVYLIFALLLVFLPFPQHYQVTLFSPLGVAVIGTVYPIYESIRAVCTPEGEDDKSWLQYWIAMATTSYLTEWIGHLDAHPQIVLYWFKFEFVLFLWLLLPYTDGAALMFDCVTSPLLAPYVQPLADKFNNWLTSLVTTVISASHLWVIWFAFVMLDPHLKRFVAVSLGVVYPVMASIVAVTTTNTYEDDTFWLTYWSCYQCLFVAMECVETWLGRIPGFYTGIILASVYLMLPLFQGADKVFRNVLVPIAGLQELLLMRDALSMKREFGKQLPKERATELRKIVSESFAKDEDNNEGDEELPTDGSRSMEENEPLIKFAKNYESIKGAYRRKT